MYFTPDRNNTGAAQQLTPAAAEALVAGFAADPDEDWTYRVKVCTDTIAVIEVYDEYEQFLGYL